MPFCNVCDSPMTMYDDFCKKCGAKVEKSIQVQEEPLQSLRKQTSRLAIASSIFGIIGLLTGPIIEIPAIIMGIIAIRQIKNTPNTQGSGLAVQGILLGIVGLIVSIIGIIYLYNTGYI